MITCLRQHTILQRIRVIVNKMRENTLLIEDLHNINILNDIVIQSIIKSEEIIKQSKFAHPWYPYLAVSIIKVALRKIKLSAVKNKKNKQHIIRQIVKKIISCDDQIIPLNIDSNDKTYTMSEFKMASRNENK